MRALGIGWVCLSLAGVARADDVVLVPGSTVNVPGGRVSGQIVAETPDLVRVAPPSGAAVDVPLDQVASISYNGQPASLGLAQARESSGVLSDALTQYSAAVDQAGGKPLVLQAAQFSRARVLARLAEAEPGKAQAAIAELNQLLTRYPESRHKGEALEWLAKLHLARNDEVKAAEALRGLEGIGWAAQRAGILQARVESRLGNHDQALAAIDRILAGVGPASTRGFEARLVRAETLAAAGRYDEAQETAQKVIDEAGPEQQETQAHAHNTLGDCLRAGGKLKDALYAYLHTDVLYDQDKEQHARALYHIAQLWRELRRPDRADLVMSRLRESYPESVYLVRETPAPP